MSETLGLNININFKNKKFLKEVKDIKKNIDYLNKSIKLYSVESKRNIDDHTDFSIKSTKRLNIAFKNINISEELENAKKTIESMENSIKSLDNESKRHFENIAKSSKNTFKSSKISTKISKTIIQVTEDTTKISDNKGKTNESNYKNTKSNKNTPLKIAGDIVKKRPVLLPLLLKLVGIPMLKGNLIAIVIAVVNYLKEKLMEIVKNKIKDIFSIKLDEIANSILNFTSAIDNLGSKSLSNFFKPLKDSSSFISNIMKVKEALIEMTHVDGKFDLLKTLKLGLVITAFYTINTLFENFKFHIENNKELSEKWANTISKCKDILKILSLVISEFILTMFGLNENLTGSENNVLRYSQALDSINIALDFVRMKLEEAREWIVEHQETLEQWGNIAQKIGLIFWDIVYIIGELLTLLLMMITNRGSINESLESTGNTTKTTSDKMSELKTTVEKLNGFLDRARDFLNKVKVKLEEWILYYENNKDKLIDMELKFGAIVLTAGVLSRNVNGIVIGLGLLIDAIDKVNKKKLNISQEEVDRERQRMIDRATERKPTTPINYYSPTENNNSSQKGHQSGYLNNTLFTNEMIASQNISIDPTILTSATNNNININIENVNDSSQVRELVSQIGDLIGDINNNIYLG